MVVSNIYVHPEYNQDSSFDADIALLELSEPVPFNSFVRPACLSESDDELASYRRCMIAGWGMLEPERGEDEWER